MYDSNLNFDESGDTKSSASKSKTTSNSDEDTKNQKSSKKLKKKHKKIKHKEFKDVLIEKFGNKTVLIWWYGALKKNRKDRSQGNVVVIYRLLNEDHSFTTTFGHFDFNLTTLVRLPIGSIWRNGIQISFCASKIRKFKINHAAFKKIYIKTSLNNASLNDSTIFLEYNKCGIIESEQSKEKTNCILFETINDAKKIRKEFGDLRGIAIPNLEFLIRGYGLSSELPRILTTFPEKERDKRLYYTDDKSPDENTWPVILGSRLTENDLVFIAYYKYANARNAANTLFHSISTNSEYKHVFPNVEPWHDQTTEIEVAGFYLEKERIFVAHTILGIEPPEHSKVERIPKTKEIEDQDGDNENEQNYPYTSLELDMDIPLVQLENVGGKKPKRQTLIKLGLFSWLGKGLHVREGDHTFVIKKSNGGVPKKEKTNQYGLSEPDNTEHVVNGTIEPKTSNTPTSHTLADHGRLLSMWEACISAQKIKSNYIKSVSYFTFQGNFETTDNNNSKPSSPPKLIAFSEDESKWHIIKNWKQESVNRGLLIIQFEFDKADAKVKKKSKIKESSIDLLYLIEIQPTIISDDNKMKESGHSGFIFRMKEETIGDFPIFIKDVLAELSTSKGSFKKLINNSYLERAEIFKHSRSVGLDEGCSSLKNALGKMDINVKFKEPKKGKRNQSKSIN